MVQQKIDQHSPEKKYEEDQIIEKAKDLEAVLISTMIEPMFPDGDDSPIFGGGKGSKIYRTLMIQEYGKIMSQNGGIGIAENIAKEIAAKQGESQ